jgi:hypothetical protein
LSYYWVFRYFMVASDHLKYALTTLLNKMQIKVTYIYLMERLWISSSFSKRKKNKQNRKRNWLNRDSSLDRNYTKKMIQIDTSDVSVVG